MSHENGSSDRSSTSTSILKVHALYKIYKTKTREVVALKGVSFELQVQEMLAIIGPSGSGKTTLFNILIGLESPSAGDVEWHLDGTSSSSVPAHRGHVGVMTQFPSLLPHHTVLDNILIRAFLCGMSPSDGVKERALSLLRRVGLEHRKDDLPSALSGGEKQKVSLCRALVTKPAVLVADEPTANLDKHWTRQWLDSLVQLSKEEQFSALILTHDQHVLDVSSRILELRDGALMGAHPSRAQFETLERTRTLVLDKDNRLVIPKEVLELMKHPTSFRLTVESSERLVLTLVREHEQQQKEKEADDDHEQ